MIPIVRGLVDTTPLNPRHYLGTTDVSDRYKLALVMSPLVIEGKVLGTYNEDTSVNSNPLFYITNLLIKITKVVKSKYQIKVGDSVIAKIHYYGYVRSKAWGKVLEADAVPFSRYQDGQTYLFALNKYHYMYVLYHSKHDNAHASKMEDTYCPYAFDISFTCNYLSMAYINNGVNVDAIERFLMVK